MPWPRGRRPRPGQRSPYRSRVVSPARPTVQESLHYRVRTLPQADADQPRGVDDDGDRAEIVDQRAGDRGDGVGGGEDEGADVPDGGEDQVLANGGDGLAAESDRIGGLADVVGHQGDVGG